MRILSLRPERSASANSATPARGLYFIPKPQFVNLSTATSPTEFIAHDRSTLPKQYSFYQIQKIRLTFRSTIGLRLSSHILN